MIVYSGSKTQFQDDILSNNIDRKVLEQYKEATGSVVGESELGAWKNSLRYMDTILQDQAIPSDTGIAIEYHIPRSSKRIDFIITGLDESRHESVIIIELKQWQKIALTDKDAIVVTRFKHGEKETPHPSYQAWSYKRLLEDYNETVDEEKIQLFPCAYLHNYEDDGLIANDFYKEYIDKAPLFLKNDAKKLREFIKHHVRYGDKQEIMYRIDHGKIRPSKNLADELTSMLKGNAEFIMVDDQKIAYETVLKLTRNSSGSKKNVIIVKGGPGTGKTVVAINLLVELTKQKLVAQYVTRNSAPREVYEAKLTGSFKKSHISNLFSGSGSFHKLGSNIYNVLIVDEAHRLNKKSGMFSHLGENQIKEIINAAEVSVFFIDEDQKVTLKDIGDREEIRNQAKHLGVAVTELELESQFRCNGSNGYLAWLDDLLQIHTSANNTIDELDYDFKIFDDPQKLHDEIIKKNKINNKARMVAGYCWNWISKKNRNLKDIVIDTFEATWNLDQHGQAWIIQTDSVSEIGCIHTCQGLEVDYVGVIIGPDLIVRNGKIITRPEKRARTDKSIFGWKKLMKEDCQNAKVKLDAIIKNTYRTLMTRGTKGCYVYFVDKETEDYFRNRVNKHNINLSQIIPPPGKVETKKDGKIPLLSKF